MKLAWLVHSKPGLPDGYALRHGCQTASDVLVSTYVHLDINDEDITQTCNTIQSIQLN